MYSKYCSRASCLFEQTIRFCIISEMCNPSSFLFRPTDQKKYPDTDITRVRMSVPFKAVSFSKDVEIFFFKPVIISAP